MLPKSTTPFVLLDIFYQGLVSKSRHLVHMCRANKDLPGPLHIIAERMNCTNLKKILMTLNIYEVIKNAVCKNDYLKP